MIRGERACLAVCVALLLLACGVPSLLAVLAGTARLLP